MNALDQFSILYGSIALPILVLSIYYYVRDCNKVDKAIKAEQERLQKTIDTLIKY